MLLKIKYRLINYVMMIGGFLFGYQAPPLPSVSAIIKKGSKILVISLSYKRGFAFPGGVLKGNEDYEAAVKREIKEETGLKVTSLSYFGTYCVVDPYSKVNITYSAKVKGELRSSEEGKAIWKQPKDLIGKMAYKDNEQALKHLLSK